MKLKVIINAQYKVTDIEKDTTRSDFIEKYQTDNLQKLPSLPAFLLPLVNYYTIGQPISKSIEVIPISGQQWQAMTAEERNQLLELVEFTGKDAGDYVRHFESMYPRTPDFRKRK